MFDPLMTLLAAKAKAVGLVAGTALATTALVGGGAVAITAVSSDTELAPETSVSQDADSTQALPAGDAAVSATPTVGIEPPAETAPVQVDSDADGLDDATGLPVGFVCDESKNHGQNVSAYARSLPQGPGRGEKVSAVAQSDCGKTEATEVETAEAEEVEEPKPAKAEKPAKPAKPAKAAKPAKPAAAEGSAERPAASEGKGKPAGAGKPEGKGKPKG